MLICYLCQRDIEGKAAIFEHVRIIKAGGVSTEPRYVCQECMEREEKKQARLAHEKAMRRA